MAGGPPALVRAGSKVREPIWPSWRASHDTGLLLSRAPSWTCAVGDLAQLPNNIPAGTKWVPADVPKSYVLVACDTEDDEQEGPPTKHKNRVRPRAAGAYVVV